VDGGPPPGGAGGAFGALPRGLEGPIGFRDMAQGSYNLALLIDQAPDFGDPLRSFVNKLFRWPGCPNLTVCYEVCMVKRRTEYVEVMSGKHAGVKGIPK